MKQDKENILQKSQLVRINLAMFFLDILRNPLEVGEKISSNLKFLEASKDRFITTNYPSPNISDIVSCTYSFSISADRCDTSFYRKDNNDVEKDFFEKFPLIIKEILSEKQIGRVGLIKYFYYECSNPQEIISKTYFKKQDYLSKSNEIYFRYNNKSVFDTIKINNLKIVETIPNKFFSNVGILFTSDINTEFNEAGFNENYINKFLRHFLSYKN